ncbi:MAG: DUF4197 domain-containing protein [Deltaproteobacteria bacterium]|nr:DUF4197 domain-containing protein [Deltaproteobacteria bacterium]MBW2308270.1 DUF4197 domain-containing protein [Deltaproteobacteria bacterium]
MLAVVLIIAIGSIQNPSAFAQFGDILKGVEKALKGRELSEGKIIQGLKEVLQIGTSNAVEMASRENGYYQNPKIKIPLPGAVRKVEKLLRAVGYGPKVDAFELSMNRAAERAAPEAKSIFFEAVTQMTFSDARKILKGPDNAATLYFKDKTHDRLYEIFKPITHKAMSEVGVTRTYQELDAKVRTLPFAGSLSFELDRYVTNGALDGLFFMLAEEERKIRQDPAARVTDLLKEVFGSASRGK